ncbi:Uncharacterized protein SCF082_LOCUS52754 [Durusdinium trenchii]|uniref:Uncharacterized protein n=1 Tax=Durusdinium trenchii TaxID=1381693 RepID=A0ABP0SNV3_9DINO
MRLRRLCEVKPSGRCYVDDTTRSDYANLERREWLELALCDALKKHGTDRKDFKKIRAEFITRVVVVREKMQLREQEVHGCWCTEAKLEQKGYSQTAGCKLFSFKMQTSNVLRPWKYNSAIMEYFVEDECKQLLKRSELTKQVEQTELDVLPDLEKFMQHIQDKIALIREMAKSCLGIEPAPASTPAHHALAGFLAAVDQAKVDVKEPSIKKAYTKQQVLDKRNKTGRKNKKNKKAEEVDEPEPKGEVYQYDDEAYQQLIRLVVADWKKLQDDGFETINQGKVYPVILGNKGDWSYLVSAAGLLRSYRRAPKGARQAKQYMDDPPGICHLCMAGTSAGDWEDLKVAERLIRHARTAPIPAPWDEVPPFGDLLHDEACGGLERYHRIDIWHTFHMGIGKAWISSSMRHLQFLTGQSNVDLRVDALNSDFTDFCAEHRKVKYLRRLEPNTFGLKSQEPNGSWNKAHITATLMEWMESFMSKHRDTCMEDELLRYIVACLSQ